MGSEIIITLPLRLTNAANSREPFWSVAKRAQEHRSVTRMAFGRRIELNASQCATITCTRIYSGRGKPMDVHDGLPGAFKSVVDGIADAMGISDNDPRVNWLYAQRKGERMEVELRVEMRAVA